MGGPQNLLTVEAEKCEVGCTPQITGLDLVSTASSDTTQISFVTEKQAADYNNYECGRRGKCDYDKGLCECFGLHRRGLLHPDRSRLRSYATCSAFQSPSPEHRKLEYPPLHPRRSWKQRGFDSAAVSLSSIRKMFGFCSRPKDGELKGRAVVSGVGLPVKPASQSRACGGCMRRCGT